MPSVDPEDISTFLADLSISRQSHSQRTEHPHWGASDVGSYYSTASVSQGVATGDLCSEASYNTIVPHPLQLSAPVAASSTGGHQSWTSSSSQSTGFGTRVAMSSTYSASTAPSMYPQQAQEVPSLIEPGVLACEFRDLVGCDRIFDAQTGRQAWIAHISRSHLRDKFPRRSKCWFCDDAAFDAGKSTDRRRYFEKRLRHVCDHIVNQGYSYEHMRPDFELVHHMRRHNLISEDDYRRYTSYSEVPERLRLEEARPLDWEPAHKVREREYNARMPHDQEREDREARREARRKSKK